MASKRTFKKYLNNLTINVLDECDYFMQTSEVKADAADKLMDEVVDFRDAMLSKIHAAKNKKEFSAIRTEFEQAEDTFLDKLNKL